MTTGIEKTVKEHIKELLDRCTKEQRDFFKRLYDHNGSKTIEEIVDTLPFNRLNTALMQCQKTVDVNKKLKINTMKQSQVVLLKTVAKNLIQKNGSTTTLEIKDELRRRFPKFKWFQSDISAAMIDIHDNKEIDGLEFVDTGEFRLYQVGDAPYSAVDTSDQVVLNSQPTSQVATKPAKYTKALGKKVAKAASGGSVSQKSRTAIVDLMKESKGRFYTVTFIKKDGSERTINGQTKKDNFMDNLGYINFRESNGNHRRVNPQTIKEISIQGNVYKVK